MMDGNKIKDREKIIETLSMWVGCLETFLLGQVPHTINTIGMSHKKYEHMNVCICVKLSLWDVSSKLFGMFYLLHQEISYNIY